MGFGITLFCPHACRTQTTITSTSTAASLFHFGIVLSKDVPGPQKGRRASLGLAMKTPGPCAKANDTGTSDAYKHDLTSLDVAEESFDCYLEAVAYKENMLNVRQHKPQRAYAVRGSV